MSITPSPAIKVFYCYAHEDRALRDKLDKHLYSLKRIGYIISWSDHDIKAGTEWDLEIENNLATAGLILLLISPDFMSSDYCYSKEMSKALEMHRLRQAYVIPIILRPVDWRGTPIEILKMLPTDGKPVTLWSNRDEALRNVAEGIRTAIEALLAPTQIPNGLIHLSNDYQEAAQEVELIRVRCKQGHLIITNKKIAIELTSLGQLIKSHTLLRTSLTSIESKTVAIPLFSAGGGMNLIFHGRGQERLVAELVSPHKKAQEIINLLS